MALQKIADTSHWSGRLDVATSRPHIQGIIAKVSESNDWGPDSEYAPTAIQCLSEGMPYSAYHFARFDADPIKQADWFITCMGGQMPNVVWWDAETVIASLLGIERGVSSIVWRSEAQKIASKLDAIGLTELDHIKISAARYLLSGQVLTDSLKWLNYMKSKGYEAGIYTSVGFAEAYLQGDASLAEFNLWIAHPYQQEPTIPAPWSAYGKWGVNPRVPLWQYSWIETVPGFPEKAVDMNYLSPLCEEAHLYFENGYPYEEEQPMTGWKFKALGNINVRSGPGTSYSVLGYVPKGTVVTADSLNLGTSSWIYHKYLKDKPGWSAAYYSSLLMEPVIE